MKQVESRIQVAIRSPLEVLELVLTPKQAKLAADKLRQAMACFPGVMVASIGGELTWVWENAEWICVEDDVPGDSDGEVLVYAPDCAVIGSKLIGKYYRGEGNNNASWTVFDYGESKLDARVTHWMPLPGKPQRKQLLGHGLKRIEVK